jgi:hypothetical protein
MEQILKWSDGNPGAMMFLMTLVQAENFVYSLGIISTLEKATTIRGTNLYVLYSDLCNKDMSKVANLCENCPINILEDACSRQDYSGRKLISEYI